MPNQYTKNKVPLYLRFWESLDKTEDCWLWQGAKGPTGYGHIWIGRDRCTSPHRYAWELENGPIPESMFVCHSCDTRLCCNPNHLFLGNAADNSADMKNKGRQPDGKTTRFYLRPETIRGEFNPQAKLSEKEVLEIRSLYANGDISYSQLGSQFGVTLSCIGWIITRINWKHI